MPDGAKVEIDYDNAEGLDDVVDNCPSDVFENKDGKVVVAHQENCTVCRICEGLCPGVKVTEWDE